MALPLILGLAGSGLAGAGMLGAGMAATPFLAGALGSGLGSLLQGDDLGTAVGTGLLSYFGGKALGGVMGGTANPADALPQAELLGSAGNVASSSLGQNMITSAGQVPASTVISDAAKQTAAATSGLSGAAGALKNPFTIGAVGVPALMEATKPPKMDFDRDDYSDIPEAEAAKRRMMTPDEDYRPGIDPEFNYFRPMQEGGQMVMPKSLRELANEKYQDIYGFTSMFIDDEGAMKRKREREDESVIARILGLGGSGKDIEGRKIAKDSAKQLFIEEYPELYKRVTGMAEGGIADLDPRSQRIQEVLRKGMNEQLMMNDKELISKVVTIIKSADANTETPEEAKMILGQFLNKYGEQALRDLAERVQSGEFDQNAMVDEGMVNGAGDGMDDMIPATLEGEQDVVLSDGEFIVPADVVSGLGNGSSDAGAKSLYEMMDRVREMRTGMTKQPEQVPQGMMLPA